MSSPHDLIDPHLLRGLQRLGQTFDAAIAKTIDASGQLAMSALKAARRDELLLTQGLLRQQRAASLGQFESAMRKEWTRQTEKGPQAAPTNWGELSLMEDAAVDAIVVSDRIGKALAHGCEWELRDMEAFTGALLHDEEAGSDRNPLRPELVARALLSAVDALTDQPALRQTLSEELTRALAPLMRSFYADTAALLRNAGLNEQALRPFSSEAGRGGGFGGASEASATESSFGGGAPGLGGNSGPGGFSGHSSMGGSRSLGGAMLGQVEAGMMTLLRQLSSHAVPLSGAGLARELAAEASGMQLSQPANLISEHREQLRQATQTPLDHMVIDVVASLFDAILADPKVPPQMARMLARLQLPVLRAALGDTSFFSKRSHPVRRFINRLASLACAFDDFAQDPGLGFMQRVGELVEQIASGDFEKVKLYDQQLDALESFVNEQQKAALQASSEAGRDAAALLERKETQARQQLQYQQQLEKALADLPLPEFLRRFLSRDWAPVIVHATTYAGEAQELLMRRMGKELAQSVLPKGGSPARRDFLTQLPLLVRGINQGLDLIGSPESVRKQMFADLLPVHAESLKTPALSPLDHNMLVKRIEAAFGLAVPDEAAAHRATASLDIDLEQVFAPGEAKDLGLMAEAAVAWSGEVDIDLDAGSEDAQLQAVDISIDGLPAAEAPLPTSGIGLFDHLEIGCVYRMNTENAWRKVRLSHISAQRSFFIFTEGTKYPKTVTMTARMLRRLCESERLRAYESAHLMERATARARRQLAALLPAKR
ncbi:MAG: DUF1631 family protein [Burkholderiales bacterium]|jgi:hypothetical protein